MTTVAALSYTTCSLDEAVKIRGETDDEYPAETLVKILTNTAQKHPSAPALKFKRDDGWQTLNYTEYLNNVRTTAKAFIQLGLEPHHPVAILGYNSPEWMFSSIGAIFAGGMSAGIYTTNNTEACRYILHDSCSNILVVENQEQMSKVLPVLDELSHLKAIVQYTGEIEDKKANMFTWADLQEIGEKADDKILEERISHIAPNHCSTLIYTSGTTGQSKGVMLSHDNINVLTQIGVERGGYFNHDYRVLSYLPLSHIAGIMADIWFPIAFGGSVAYAGPDALKGSLIDDLKIARPTLFTSVPRLYEKVQERLLAVGAELSPFRRKVGAWAKRVTLEGNKNIEKGRSTPFGWFLATKILHKLHERLGLDQCYFCGVTAAPVSKQTHEYWASINLPLYEMYGLSETTGLAVACSPDERRTGSVGRAQKMMESKVDENTGEICFRGRTIMMGYLNNEEKTREAIDDQGWLHTGDIGNIDKDGFFYITGRIKELVITAGGENVAPVPIEDAIKREIPLIATAVVIGDRRKFLSVLLTCLVEMDLGSGLPSHTLQPVAVQYLQSVGVQASRSDEICANVSDELREAIQAGIDRANQSAPSHVCKVQKWKLLPLDFTVATGELGPTQKLRRPFVVNKYKNEIEEFYK